MKTGYRFYPLENFTRQGILAPPLRGKPVAAEFLTLEQAKAMADRLALAIRTAQEAAE